MSDAMYYTIGSDLAHMTRDSMKKNILALKQVITLINISHLGLSPVDCW